MSREMPRFRYHSKKIILQTKSLSLLEKGYASLLVNGGEAADHRMSFTWYERADADCGAAVSKNIYMFELVAREMA